MQTYKVTLTGQTPMLQHADNVEWSDTIAKWLLDPEHKKQSKAGDDRTPPFLWLGNLNHDGQRVTVPADNLMAALREAGTMVPTGKGTKTFKAQTQSGLAIGEANWPLMVNGKEVPTAPLFERMETRDFAQYQRLCAGYGFSLFVKRAKVGLSKHIRVRPAFDNWTAQGTIIVLDDMITEDVLRTILSNAGRYKGLGDWRPGGRTPGTFGMFKAYIVPDE